LFLRQRLMQPLQGCPSQLPRALEDLRF
jgi:hypothetical protein